MSEQIVSNPINILKQEKSEITTNPFIPNEQKNIEITLLNKEANDIIEREYNNNKINSIANLSIKDIFKNISSSFIGLFNDIFTKPNDVEWSKYIQIILVKDQRYAYIGFLLILISIYIAFIK